MSLKIRNFIPAVLILAGTSLLPAQVSTTGPRYTGPDGEEISMSHANDFRDLLDRFSKDRETFQR